jgi:hypothetical protein
MDMGEDNAHAILYRGNSGGFDDVPAWFARSEQPTLQGGEVAAAGDIDADGFADIAVGLSGSTEGGLEDAGAVGVYGHVFDPLTRGVRQMRSDDSAPIQVLGRSSAQTSFRLRALGRTAAGRGRVRLQFEVKPADVPFDATGLVSGSWIGTGAPGAAGSTVPLSVLASNLGSGTLYKWRLRVLAKSPCFPASPWFGLADNAITLADVRTLSAVGVDEPPPAPPPATAWLGHGLPNPFTNLTEITYALPTAGRVELDVYDVQGRKVASLVDRREGAGIHLVRWDGRDDAGARQPAGVYFARMVVGDAVVTRKMIIVR